MDSLGQVELPQTLLSFADLSGIMGRGPTTCLLLPEHHLIIAFGPLTATGFLPSTTPTQFTRKTKASPGF